MNDMTTTNYEEIGSPLSVSVIKHQIQVIQEVMRDAMVKDTHYGVIPGTDKPTLLKAGAEKLSLTFRLSPTYVVTRLDLQNGHREYEVRCTLTHIPTQAIFGEGVGTCSSMESKYRYRNISDFELTGEPIPKDSKERKAEYRKQGFGMKKVNGNWEWVKYKDSEKQEHPDIADTYNTILKMAKKRAHVDAVLTATAASDIFAQDLEDLPQNQIFVKPEESTPFNYHEASVDDVPFETEKLSDEEIKVHCLALTRCETLEALQKYFASAIHKAATLSDVKAKDAFVAAKDKRKAELQGAK